MSDEENVVTVVGSWLNFEAGDFALRVLSGRVSGDWDFVFSTKAPVDRLAIEGEVLRRANQQWAEPETRERDAIAFAWTG